MSKRKRRGEGGEERGCYVGGYVYVFGARRGMWGGISFCRGARYTLRFWG
jgi:hypothetical protein